MKRLIMHVVMIMVLGVPAFMVTTEVNAQELVRDKIRERIKKRMEARRKERLGKFHKKNSASNGLKNKFELQHDGYKREFYVHVPQSYRPETPTPLIINYHGGNGSEKSVKKGSLMLESSEKEGYLVAIPLALPSKAGAARWNNGPRVPEKQGISDDVGFTRKMLDIIKSKYNINSDMIYATGISNGGMMAYRLACELSDQIAAAAIIGSTLMMPECAPSRPISIMHIHGKKDPLVLYGGGVNDNPSLPKKLRLGEDLRSVEESIDIFRSLNHCPAASEITYQRGEAICKTFGPCDAKTEVVLCTIEDGGHTWPGGSYPTQAKFYKPLVGKLSHDLNANDVMWEFFQRHPMN